MIRLKAADTRDPACHHVRTSRDATKVVVVTHQFVDGDPCAAPLFQGAAPAAGTLVRLHDAFPPNKSAHQAKSDWGVDRHLRRRDRKHRGDCVLRRAGWPKLCNCGSIAARRAETNPRLAVVHDSLLPFAG
jgi:hypothetical protein